jgi:hypothetical protein
MIEKNRAIFLLNGTRENWKIGKERSIWGLPLHRRKWNDVLAELQEVGFAAGAEILAIAGPFALLRAVIGSDRGVFFDDQSAPWGMDQRDDIYPVRIELTKIQEIGKHWYLQTHGKAWQGILIDRFFGEHSLYVLRSGVENDPNVDREVMFGNYPPDPHVSKLPPTLETSEILSPEDLESRAADLFADLGFRVEQLGHKNRFEKVPDGIAFVPRSFAEHLQRLNEKPYFILWDCKFDCSAQGLSAHEERAIREYITDFAQKKKLEMAIPEFWFLIIARSRQVAARIQTGMKRVTWPDDLRSIGCRGFRIISFARLVSLVREGWNFRRNGNDPDSFLGQELPRILRSGNLS